MIGSRYADFVICRDDAEPAVIEVKQIDLKLKDTHLNQARQYATDEGIEWIILTNGDTWKIYRNVLEGTIPVAKPVFAVTVADEEMKPSEKTSLLYLMSEESARKHEIQDYYDRKIALSGENLADYVLSEEVLNNLRLSLRAGTGQKLGNYEVARALIVGLFCGDVITEEAMVRLEKIRRGVSK